MVFARNINLSVQDSVIYERLSTRLNSREDVETMQEHANFYASLGYRTLWFASSKIDDNVYERWSARYKEASNALQKRQQRLAKVADEIEQDLRLIGVSAIEDRLQDVRGFFLFENFKYLYSNLHIL